MVRRKIKTVREEISEDNMPQFAKDHLMKESKPYDKYVLDNKLRGFVNTTWVILTRLSYLVVIVFILMTCFVFWLNIGAEYPIKLPQIITMIYVVRILLLIIAMDFIIKLISKSE